MLHPEAPGEDLSWPLPASGGSWHSLACGCITPISVSSSVSLVCGSPIRTVEKPNAQRNNSQTVHGNRTPTRSRQPPAREAKPPLQQTAQEASLQEAGAMTP